MKIVLSEKIGFTDRRGNVASNTATEAHAGRLPSWRSREDKECREDIYVDRGAEWIERRIPWLLINGFGRIGSVDDKFAEGTFSIIMWPVLRIAY